MKYRYCGEYPLCFFPLSTMGVLWQASLWSGTWRVATLFDTPPLYRAGTGRKVETSGTHRRLSHTQDSDIIQAGQALMVSCVSAHRAGSPFLQLSHTPGVSARLSCEQARDGYSPQRDVPAIHV